jgi:16S rRNA C1402 (ribose-2'-O) methylase RsmI
MESVSQGKVRGEVVILVAPGEIMLPEAEPLGEVLLRLMSNGELSVKDVARKAADITGVSRNEAYREALKLRNNED